MLCECAALVSALHSAPARRAVVAALGMPRALPPSLRVGPPLRVGPVPCTDAARAAGPASLLAVGEPGPALPSRRVLRCSASVRGDPPRRAAPSPALAGREPTADMFHILTLICARFNTNRCTHIGRYARIDAPHSDTTIGVRSVLPCSLLSMPGPAGRPGATPVLPPAWRRAPLRQESSVTFSVSCRHGRGDGGRSGRSEQAGRSPAGSDRGFGARVIQRISSSQTGAARVKPRVNL